MEEVKAAQKAWADAIKKISKTYLDGGDYVAAAANAAGELYGYGHGNVLFKPTKAKDVQFRPEASQAMSYFVGAKAVKQADGIAEDGGFAINGGKGWSDVAGDYMTFGGFTEHTLFVSGLVREKDFLSSICAGPVNSRARRQPKRQAKPKRSGRANAMLAPPQAEQEAVGYQRGALNEVKVVSDISEFLPGLPARTGVLALLFGGEGQDLKAEVVFSNHKIELNGNVAIAMGNYDFTSAADGSKTKVEYTFGYKKCKDGKVRIFLHHSSVPFNPEASKAETALKQEATNTSSVVGTIFSRIAGS
eukprot:Skav220100  [mRNA]  locus=scaffold1991:150465:156219:- [translate_table: standard]